MLSRSLFCRQNDCGSVRSKVQGLSTPFPFSKKAVGSHWSCTTWKSGFGSFHQKSQEESLHESQADTRPLGPWVSCCDSEVREWRHGWSGKGERGRQDFEGQREGQVCYLYRFSFGGGRCESLISITQPDGVPSIPHGTAYLCFYQHNLSHAVSNNTLQSMLILSLMQLPHWKQE